MKTLRIGTLAVLAMVGSAAAAPVAAADAGWAGYYVAIDPDDGSIATMSIAPTADETFQIIMQTDQLSLCPDRSKGGFLVAAGRIVDGDLIREDGRFKCEGDADFRAWQPGSYQRDGTTGIISQSGGHDGRTFYFHPSK